jgi:hypothetical protein
MRGVTGNLCIFLNYQRVPCMAPRVGILVGARMAGSRALARRLQRSNPLSTLIAQGVIIREGGEIGIPAWKADDRNEPSLALGGCAVS